MKIDKRLSIALMIATVTFVPAVCDESSISGGHIIGFSGLGTVYSGSNGDPIVSPGTNTIQAVLNDPGTKDGSTLTLLPGLFKTSNSGPNPYTTIDVSKSVNIAGWLGPTWTHVNGEGLGSVFTIEAGKRVTLSGMTIENGAADMGAGIFNRGILTVKNCKLINNHATIGGGGIFNEGTVNMYGGSITRNTATFGGGIFNEGTLNLNHVLVSDCYSDFFGGGIYNGGTLNLKDVQMTGNTAVYGSAIFNDDSDFWFESYGGVLNMNQGTSLTDNFADVSGTIYNWGTVNMYGGSITRNTATYGGGIYNDGIGGTATINMNKGSSIAYNTADYGGGIYNHGNGGAAIVNMNQRSSITGNTAKYGGGIYNNGEGPLSTATINMNKGSSIVHNTAYAGGGVYNYYGTLNQGKGTIKNNNPDDVYPPPV
jgi:hypothetical protein